MIWQLNGPWPICGGRVLVPATTILDRTDWQYLGVPLPWPPTNAVALDQEAYDALLEFYPAYSILTGNADIIRTGDAP